MPTATQLRRPTAREARYQESPPCPFTKADDDKHILISFACAVRMAESVIIAGQEEHLPTILEGYREAVVHHLQGDIDPFYKALSDEAVTRAARASVKGEAA